MAVLMHVVLLVLFVSTVVAFAVVVVLVFGADMLGAIFTAFTVAIFMLSVFLCHFFF